MLGQQHTSLAEQLRSLLPPQHLRYARGLAVVLARINAGKGGAAELHRFLSRTEPYANDLLDCLAGASLRAGAGSITFGSGRRRGVILFEEGRGGNMVAIWVRHVTAPPAPRPALQPERWVPPLGLAVLLGLLALGVILADVARRSQPAGPRATASLSASASALRALDTGAPTAPPAAPPPTAPPAAPPPTAPPAAPLAGVTYFEKLAPGTPRLLHGWELTFADPAHAQAFPPDLGDSAVKGRLVVLAIRVTNRTGRAQPLPASLVAIYHNRRAWPPSAELSLRYALREWQGPAPLPLGAPIPADGQAHSLFLAFDMPPDSANLFLYAPEDARAMWPVLPSLE